MKKVIFAYIPVLHQGYYNFFKKYASEAPKLFIMGEKLIGTFSHLRKDIRALAPKDIKRAIDSWRLFETVYLAESNDLANIASSELAVIMPDEDECHELAQNYLNSCDIEFVPVFLRWDKTKSLNPEEVKADRIIPFDGLAAEVLTFAAEMSKNASNWWRQVGAVVVRDGQMILMAHNCHVPTAREQYFEGDPRSLFKRGLHIELTTDFHAEAQIIAAAVKKGISLEGTDLYVTTFPCPSCAKLVAYSGIKKCYFSSGYAMLDGESILKNQGVEIIFVK